MGAYSRCEVILTFIAVFMLFAFAFSFVVMAIVGERPAAERWFMVGLAFASFGGAGGLAYQGFELYTLSRAMTNTINK